MKVVVFGKNGQVAHHLALTKPKAVSLACYGSREVDFSQAPDFDSLIKGADLVINASAYTAVDMAEDPGETEQAWSINAQAVGDLAFACAQAGCPLFHISTDYCYPGTKPIDQAYTEDDAVGPTGAYGASKLAGDLAVLSSGAQAYIFRTAWVYSAHGKNFVKTMLWLADNKEEVGIVADQYGNPTSAADIASALWQAASTLNHAPAPGIYHLTGQGSTSWHGFAQFIFDALQEKAMKVPKAVNALTTEQYPTKAKRPANSQLSCKKLSDHFGISMPHWQTSTQHVIDQLTGQP